MRFDLFWVPPTPAHLSGPPHLPPSPLPLLTRGCWQDQRSQDYDTMSMAYRPSHADATYDAKYGIRAVAGGGRSSARETIGRVAAAAVARKVRRGAARGRSGVRRSLIFVQALLFFLPVMCCEPNEVAFRAMHISVSRNSVPVACFLWYSTPPCVSYHGTPDCGLPGR